MACTFPADTQCPTTTHWVYLLRWGADIEMRIYIYIYKCAASESQSNADPSRISVVGRFGVLALRPGLRSTSILRVREP